jgi:phosphate transport system protein
MSHLDSEIRYLKEELMDMHRLVHLQVSKCKTALLTLDADLAREILVTEKRVNGLELKIDRDCENILALFNPVAVDLRFVLAALKINSNLERIGDNAESIARYVLDVTVPFPQELVSAYAIEHLADTALSMLEDAMAALEKDDTAAARKIFLKDDLLDVINRKATAITIELIQAKNAMPLHFLNLLSIVRKFERIGDQTKNISEEIIFFIEAKVLRHGQKLD